MIENQEILTPDQAAAYLQLNRETIYRYIREGRLVASRFGRSYRIPRRSLDLLLIATQTIEGVPLRSYSKEQVEGFLADDQLTEPQRAIADRMDQALGEMRAKDQPSTHRRA